MSYIGNEPVNGNFSIADAITTSSTATYALTVGSVAFTPESVNHCIVSLNGVVQAPTNAFTISGTNIVFASALTSSDVIDFIYFLGNVNDIGTPSDGTVSLAKMAVNSIDSDQYVDGSIDTAHIGATQVTGAKLNTDVISAQTALAVEPADTDEFMVSDGGVLKRIDYSLIKAASGGLTEADTWRITPSLTLDGSINTWYYITTNWARCTGDGFGQPGTGLTESSGVFSFPSTGYWLIDHWFNLSANTGAINEWYISLHTTLNDADYGEATFTQSSQKNTNYSTSSNKRFVFDVTNTTNCKFKFKTYYSAQNNVIQGDGGYNYSGFDVIKLADT